MTKITWGDKGDLLYETGADRGVLYIPGIDGVPWNGLISVDESPSGASPVQFYIDGFNYLNLSGSEEYEARIEAFTAPLEFAACDGYSVMHKGLFISQQRRTSFHLTYRTLLGNDVSDIEYGYKIHLVYNALASPPKTNHVTLGDNVEAAVFGWDITTTPAIFPGIRPTAHLVVDSSKTSSARMSALEDQLYGDIDGSPRMPTPTELLAIFA